uniref:DDE Tnp4 domain-containing protein n=1 Tax=Sinocyclocheilus rhinocerous TaxID=307959 RepID=A0A673GDD1_9TELE
IAIPERGLGSFVGPLHLGLTLTGTEISGFRSRETFLFICHELRPHLQRTTTHYRKPLSVENRVAVALWRLSTNTEYRTISHLFGIGISTVCIITREVVHAIVQVLMPKFIKVPQGNVLRDIVNGFRDKWGFPQCVGAIDGTHVPMIAPRKTKADFYNRMGYYSVLLQAVVDHKLQFWDINVGWPGKVHDARVFANSSLFRKGPSVIGDPFAEGQGLTRAEQQYNYRLSRARMCVECAFGRPKARRRCLLKRNDHSTNTVIAACCTLHNICESRGEALEPNLIDDNDNEMEIANT